MRIFISLSLKVINRNLHINNCSFRSDLLNDVECWKNLFYYTSKLIDSLISHEFHFHISSPSHRSNPLHIAVIEHKQRQLIFNLKNRQHKSRRMKSNYSKFVVKHQRCQWRELEIAQKKGISYENYCQVLANAASVKSEGMKRIVVDFDAKWQTIARFIARILVSCFHVVNSNNIKTAQLCHLSHEIYGDAFVSFLHFQLVAVLCWCASNSLDVSKGDSKSHQKYFFFFCEFSDHFRSCHCVWINFNNLVSTRLFLSGYFSLIFIVAEER